MSPDPDPTPDPTPDPDPSVTPPAGGNSLTATEVKSLMSEALDERLESLGLTDKLSKLDILDGLDERIDGIVSKHKSDPNTEGLTKSLETMLDNKLRNLGVQTGRKVGVLGRWLSPSSS